MTGHDRISAQQAARCPICDWPFAESREKGCVPGDCSYRPDDPAEQTRIALRRKDLSTSPQETNTAVEEAFKRFPDKVEPVDYHPAGKIIQDNGGLRYAFVEGAKFGSAAENNIGTPIYGHSDGAFYGEASPPSPALTEPTREALELARSAFHDQGIADRVPITLGRIERALAALTHPAPAAQQNEPVRWEFLTSIIRPMIESVCSDGNSDAARLAKDIADAILAAPPAPSSPPGMREALEPFDAPSVAQINSACLSYRHDFGLLDEAERQKVKNEACWWLDAWRKEGFGCDSNEVIERCAAVVDQANREGPYQAIAAASRIRALKTSTPPSPEPAASPLGKERSHGTERQAAIADVVQYLESEGHGIPAEKVRAAFSSTEAK